METPDFTGLHGKELIKKHTKWRREQIKAGTPERKIRYAGLTREQAIEIFHYNNRGIGIGEVTAGVLVSIANIVVAIVNADTQKLAEPFATFAKIPALTIGVILIAWGLYHLLSVRTPQSTRKAYIHSEDERVQEAQRKSGLFPITIISFAEMQIGYFVSHIINDVNSAPSVQIGVSSVGLTIYAMGLLQILISLIIYHVLRKRN